MHNILLVVDCGVIEALTPVEERVDEVVEVREVEEAVTTCITVCPLPYKDTDIITPYAGLAIATSCAVVVAVAILALSAVNLACQSASATALAIPAKVFRLR
jgi:hypothetical protein